MTTAPQPRGVIALLAAAAVVLAVIGTGVVLVGNEDPAAIDAATAPTAPATPSPAGSGSDLPSASPSAAPSPQGDSPLADLEALVPQRVAGFTQAANRQAALLAAQPHITEARRVRYRGAAGAQVTHVVALHRDNAAAGQALRQRRARLLNRRGARIVDETALEDSDGVRRGRLVEVGSRSGAVVVLWRNRNLVAELGPGRSRLVRRLYDAWPY